MEIELQMKEIQHLRKEIRKTRGSDNGDIQEYRNVVSRVAIANKYALQEMAVRLSPLDRTAIRKFRSVQKIGEHGITVERLAGGDLRYSFNIMDNGRRMHCLIGRNSKKLLGHRARNL